MSGHVATNGWYRVSPAFRLAAASASRRAPRSSRRPAAPVVVTRVNSAVWSTALDLADGEPARIEVIDATTVVVHNHRKGQK